MDGRDLRVLVALRQNVRPENKVSSTLALIPAFSPRRRRIGLSAGFFFVFRFICL